MLSIATGYSVDYLLRQVAAGRENYYTGAVADGEPPGRWWGAGATALGLEGEVDPQDMRAVFERFLDPRDEAFRDPSRWGEAATLGHTGRAYTSEDELYAAMVEREPHATAERRDELRVEAGRKARRNVAFLDVTFSVQKSVTVLHTAFEAEEVRARRAGDLEAEAMWAGYRQAVEAAIWAGNDAALTYLQDHAGYARIGHHGGTAGRWVDAHSWTVASFFQHDSRDHDPQLHIHNPIVNRVASPDGEWRTLDSRAVHRMRPAAAAVGERVLSERLMADLGVRMAMRPDGKAREATIVSPTATEMFSSRRRAVSAKAAELIAAFEARHGREVNGIERDRLQRQATLTSRRAKSHHGETREQLLDRVDAQIASEVTGGLASVAHAYLNTRNQPGDEAGEAVGSGGIEGEVWSPDAVLEAALAGVQAKKASWTRADLVREIDARLPDYLGIDDPDQIAELLDRLSAHATAMATSLDTDAPGEDLLPDELRLANGASAYRAPGGGLYATPEHVHSENTLRAAVRDHGATRLAPRAADTVLRQLQTEGVELGADQAAAVRGVLTSGASLETLIGPAGTGKSFTVGALARAWTQGTTCTGPADRPVAGRVFGLATSQVAADVLTAEGLTAANTARWLAAQDRLARSVAENRAPLEHDRPWCLGRGDLVVVDESSMADTAALTRIHQHVERTGAKLLLVGDHRQLAAVGASGAMDLIAATGARYELTDTRRFTHPWEGPASLRLRASDPTVVADYHRNGRLIDAGTVEQAEASAARAWLADTLAGRSSVLVVDTNDQAARLSSQLRHELVRLGRVAEHGVALDRDGTYAGVGDTVAARRNGWELAGRDGNPRGPINRETFTVLETGDDGSLVVTPTPGSTRDEGGAGVRLVLPADYVAADVSLAYAGTVHAVEGLSVDTSHPVITPRTSPAAAYVGLSRGRENNTGHIATTAAPEDPAHGTPQEHSLHRDPRSVLADTLENADDAAAATRAAVATAEAAAEEAGSVQTAAERFADAAHLASLERTSRWLDQLTTAGHLGPEERARIAAEDGTATLTRLLRAAELAGHDPQDVLDAAVIDRPLDGARSVTYVLHGRITAAHTFDPLGDTWQSWRPRLDDPAWDTYLAALAEAADTRTRDLGDQQSKAPDPWAIELLGPVPDDPTARADWTQRAGLIAGYREARDHDQQHQPTDERGGARSGVDAVDALGSAPGRGQVEAHAAYRAAWRAAGLPEHDRDTLELSIGAHRARVQAWEREQTWGPAYVDNLLAGTHQAAEQHHQTAQLRRAEAANTTDPDQRGQLQTQARDAAALAGHLREEAGRLEEVAQAYAAWSAETAMTRALADQSRAYLATHDATTDPAPPITAAEWLAAERAARIEDDPHREISDTDLTEPVETVNDTQRPRREHAATHDTDRAPADDRQEPVAAEAMIRPGGRSNTARAADDEPATHADTTEQERSGAPGHRQGGVEACEGPAPAASERVQENDLQAADGPRRDTRDAAEPRPRDHDVVRVPEPDETMTELARARRALAEITDRRHLEHQHDQRDRDHQLAQWHTDDRDSATTGSGIEQPAHDADDTNQQ